MLAPPLGLRAEPGWAELTNTTGFDTQTGRERLGGETRPELFVCLAQRSRGMAVPIHCTSAAGGEALTHITTIQHPTSSPQLVPASSLVPATPVGIRDRNRDIRQLRFKFDSSSTFLGNGLRKNQPPQRQHR